MFDWSDYLDLAGNLIDESDIPASEEAKARSSISRSYYCIYHFAREFLLEEDDINIGKKMPDSHKYVIDQLIYRNATGLSQIGEDLKRLKDERVKADYNKNKEINLETAKIAWRRASRIKIKFRKEIKNLRTKRN